MFNIKIENFEGPLDLLLYFIKRDKIDIYDIPITQITNEYISVIDEAKKLDVSIAGEFLFMASMLLRIKTQMLLPRQINDESLDIEDPRIDLVAQLLEYKKYKSIANKLKNLHFENKDSFFRNSSKVVYDQSPNASDFLNEVTLYDISKIFKDAVNNAPTQDSFEIYRETVSLKDQQDFILQQFNNDKISIKRNKETVELKARPTALKRSFENIIQNGLTYGNKVDIDIQKGNNRSFVIFDDDGPGIPEDQYKNVFKPFFRLDKSRSLNQSGVGLGLSLIHI